MKANQSPLTKSGDTTITGKCLLGGRGVCEMPQGTETVRGQFHQLMECFRVAVVSGRVSEISPGCTSQGPWERGSKLSLSRSREARSTALPWLPSRACLKAFQESLRFVETGSHSPKDQHSYTPCSFHGCFSLLSLTPIKKGKSGPLFSTHAEDLS